MIKITFPNGKQLVSKASPQEVERILLICKRGGNNSQDVVIAYDGAIYASMHFVAPDVLEHEKLHLERQAAYQGGIDAYVERYFSDRDFMIDEEARAYRRQYQFICSTTTDKAVRFKALQKLASQLAGPVYGNKVSAAYAARLIGAGLDRVKK